MNELETPEEAIEVMMDRIAKYKGIKRINSYYLFAQQLERYAEMCILYAENKVITDEKKR